MATTPSKPLPADVIAALRSGNKIEAIKRLRRATGLGLKEAKDWVDAFEKETPSSVGTGGPGEVSRSISRVWWVVAAAVAALVAYYLLRNPG